MGKGGNTGDFRGCFIVLDELERLGTGRLRRSLEGILGLVKLNFRFTSGLLGKLGS
jgi:hypothetical protein